MGDEGSTGVDGASVVCEPETYTWTGSAVLSSSSDVVVTGIVIAAQLGTRIVVLGTSADGIDAASHATALPIRVGGALASPGSTPDRGPITIHGPTTSSLAGPLTVTGATVAIHRCAEVAVADTGAAVPTTVVISGAGALPTTTAASPPGASPAAAPASTNTSGARATSLPATGGGGVPAALLLGGLLVGAGAAGVVAAACRRRSTAVVLAPGSPRAAQPRARH